MKLKYLFHIDHFLVTTLALVLLWLLSIITFNLSILDPVADALDEFSITDVFFEIENNKEENIETSDLITIVDMTDLHNRGDIASLMQEIGLNNPLCVGIDLIFEGEKDDSIGNKELVEAVNNLGETAIYSKKLTDYSGETDKFANRVSSFFTKDIEVQEAYTNLVNDMSSTRVREFTATQQEGETESISFPAAIASRFDTTLVSNHKDSYLINYRNVKFPVVKFDEIQEKADLIDGHIVLIGTMTEEQDMHMTPLGKMPGIEVQAYSLLTLLEHKDLQELPLWLSILITFVLCYLLEITIDAVPRCVEKSTKIPIVFLRESGLITALLILLWVIVVTWLMFYSFTRWNVIIDGGVLLASMALVCEGRELIEATIKTLSTKYNWKYLKKSIFS